MPETAKLKLPYPPGPQANDIPADIKRLVDRLEVIEKQGLGQWRMTFRKVAAERFMLMLGQTIQRTSYPDFFEALGLSGASWVVPNMARRVPIGAVDQNTLAQQMGSSTNQITLNASQNGEHNHGGSYSHVHDPGNGYQYVITSPLDIEQHYIPKKSSQPPGGGYVNATFTNAPGPNGSVSIGNSGNGAAIDISNASIVTNFEIQVL